MQMQNDAVIGCRLSKSLSFSQDEELYIATSDTRIKMEEDYAPFVDKILSDTAQTPQAVLNLGCGPGYLARRLRDVLPDAFVLGLDKSAVMIAHANRAVGVKARTRVGHLLRPAYETGIAAGTGMKMPLLREPGYDSAAGCMPTGSGLMYMVGDSASLPFFDSTFDLIILKGTFKCLDDKLSSLREMFRTLRRGGEILIYEFRKEIGESEFNMLTKHMNPQKVKSLKRKLNCSLNAEDYEKYLSEAGLEGFFEIKNDGIDLKIKISRSH